MPPPTRRPSPVVQMRTQLASCRRAGLSFDVAWARSIRAVKWPYDTEQRREWRYALRAARAEFKAAYEGTETPVSRCSLLRSFDISFLTESGVPSEDLDGMVAASAL